MTDQVVYFTGAMVWVLIACGVSIAALMLIIRAGKTVLFMLRVKAAHRRTGSPNQCFTKGVLYAFAKWFVSPPWCLEAITGETVYWPGARQDEEDGPE